MHCKQAGCSKGTYPFLNAGPCHSLGKSITEFVKSKNMSYSTGFVYYPPVFAQAQDFDIYFL